MPVFQICDKRGHTDRVCLYRYDELSDSAPSRGTRALHAYTSNSSSYWYLDTDANSHVTPDYSKLHNPTSYSSADTITVGNGQSLPISNIGSGFVYTPTGTFSLYTLHHVPSLTSNLLSAYLFTIENNCTLLFNAHNFQIVDNLTKQIRYKGRCEQGLYTLPSKLSTSISTSSVANQSIRSSTWPRRLGHPCAEVTKSILSFLGFSFSTKDYCE